MKRTAELDQRHLRRSLGCAHFGSPLMTAALPGSADMVARRTSANLNDSCGSVLV